MERKTKIIATISDRRCEVGFLKSLFDAGMNVARINSAHVTTESADRIVNNIRQVSDRIAIMIDTKGPEIRTTPFAPGISDGIHVEQGEILNISGTSDNLQSTRELIYLNTSSIFSDVPVGATILIDDGDIELHVIHKKDGILRAEVRNKGLIGSRKSVNIPGIRIDLPSITDRDREFIDWAISREIDFIAHSFVRSREDVLAVKKIIEEQGSPIKVISKIENREGVDNIDEILKETYGIMVARGDLGVEVPAEELPVVQRSLVQKSIQNKVPVIIATQMLHSMMENPRPTRAEVSDIASAVYQRVDAIMLSGETANGLYPVESVATMDRIALQIEKDGDNAPAIDITMIPIDNEVTAQLARSAVRASNNLPVKAIVIDTMTGRTGRYLAAFRAQRNVFAICYRKSVMRQLALSFGIVPMYSKPSVDHNSFLRKSLVALRELLFVEEKDLIVVMGGDFGVTSGASFIEIATVGMLENKVSGFLGTANIDSQLEE